MLIEGRRRARGFTIIEVIVTLVIFAILLSVAIPGFNKWVSNTKVRSTADALQNGLRLAQAESLRRSRQLVFSLTNSTAPQTSLTAAANGINWSVNTIPSMTDGTETSQFIEAGVLTTTNAGVTIAGQAAVCFNSVGRLVANTSTGIVGAVCSLPGASPPVLSYVIASPKADRTLQVNVALGGQVHLCDPAKTLSAANPDGC